MSRPDVNLALEELESRFMLSLVFGWHGHDHVHHSESGHQLLIVEEHHRPGHGGGGGGGGGGGPPSGPAIDLATVAAHEFGHSLGLPHTNHPDCSAGGSHPLMCAFYDGPSFELHADDIAAIQNLYGSGGGWASTDITFSFMPDGSRMDQGGRNTLFKTMNGAFGNEATWQQIFVDALNLWRSALPSLSFTLVADNGAAFNASGASQGDSRFGDIRIGSHGFDGASGVLAHAYFPPPNGATAAGDAHFDKAENWQDLRGSLVDAHGHDHDHHDHLHSKRPLVAIDVAIQLNSVETSFNSEATVDEVRTVAVAAALPAETRTVFIAAVDAGEAEPLVADSFVSFEVVWADLSDDHSDEVTTDDFKLLPQVVIMLDHRARRN